MRSCIMPGLPMHLVKELNVVTVERSFREFPVVSVPWLVAAKSSKRQISVHSDHYRKLNWLLSIGLSSLSC